MWCCASQKDAVRTSELSLRFGPGSSAREARLLDVHCAFFADTARLKRLGALEGRFLLLPFELMRKLGVLIFANPRDVEYTFVSHQWESADHPFPTGLQITEGLACVSTPFMWLDWYCAPQWSREGADAFATGKPQHELTMRLFKATLRSFHKLCFHASDALALLRRTPTRGLFRANENLTAKLMLYAEQVDRQLGHEWFDGESGGLPSHSVRSGEHGEEPSGRPSEGGLAEGSATPERALGSDAGGASPLVPPPPCVSVGSFKTTRARLPLLSPVPGSPYDVVDTPDPESNGPPTAHEPTRTDLHATADVGCHSSVATASAASAGAHHVGEEEAASGVRMLVAAHSKASSAHELRPRWFLSTRPGLTHSGSTKSLDGSTRMVSGLRARIASDAGGIGSSGAVGFMQTAGLSLSALLAGKQSRRARDLCSLVEQVEDVALDLAYGIRAWCTLEQCYLPEAPIRDPRLLQAIAALKKLRQATERAKRIKSVRKPLDVASRAKGSASELKAQAGSQGDHESCTKTSREATNHEARGTIDSERSHCAKADHESADEEVEPIARLLNLLDQIDGYIAQCEISAHKRAAVLNVWTFHFVKSRVLQITNTDDYRYLDSLFVRSVALEPCFGVLYWHAIADMGTHHLKLAASEQRRRHVSTSKPVTPGKRTPVASVSASSKPSHETDGLAASQSHPTLQRSFLAGVVRENEAERFNFFWPEGLPTPPELQLSEMILGTPGEARADAVGGRPDRALLRSLPSLRAGQTYWGLGGAYMVDVMDCKKRRGGGGAMRLAISSQGVLGAPPQVSEMIVRWSHSSRNAHSFRVKLVSEREPSLADRRLHETRLAHAQLQFGLDQLDQSAMNTADAMEAGGITADRAGLQPSKVQVKVIR